MTEKQRAREHAAYRSVTALAILLPVLGVVAGVVLLTKKDRLDRALGEHAIVTSIACGVLWALVYVAASLMF